MLFVNELKVHDLSILLAGFEFLTVSLKKICLFGATAWQLIYHKHFGKTSHPNLSAAQTNILFISPELAHSLVAALSARLHLKYGNPYPSLCALLLLTPHLSISLNIFTSFQLSLI
jgi:hypothetical protein